MYATAGAPGLCQADVACCQMPDEEAFSLLVRLMYSYDLRGHFLPEMPKLQLRLVCLVTLSFKNPLTTSPFSFRYAAAAPQSRATVIHRYRIVRASDRRIAARSPCALSTTRDQIQHVLFAVVSHPVQLPVRMGTLHAYW